MMNYISGKTREEKIDLFLDNLAWYFSEKKITDQTAKSINSLKNAIEEADKSSKKLAIALNIITAAGIFIAIAALIPSYITSF